MIIVFFHLTILMITVTSNLKPISNTFQNSTGSPHCINIKGKVKGATYPYRGVHLPSLGREPVGG